MKKKGSIFGNLNKILVRVDVDKNFYDRRSGFKYLCKYQFFLSKCKKIAIVPIPNIGLGLTIHDRIKRASKE